MFRPWMLLLLALLPHLFTLSCTKSPEEKFALQKARGHAFLQEGKVDEAIIELRAALQTRPESTEVLFDLGEALLRKGNMKEAYQVFQKVTELDPSNLDAQIRLGDLYLLANSTTEAKERAERVIEASPKRADAYFLLGKAYLKEGNLDEALNQIDHAIQLKPDELSYRLFKSTVLLTTRRLKEARTELEALLAKEPDNAEALLLLSQVAELQGDTDAVERAFKRAFEAGADNPSVWISYGNYCVKKGNLTKALDAYRKAGSVEQKGTRGWEKAAETALAIRDSAATREAIAKIREKNPKSTVARYFEARLLLQEGKFGEAIPQLQEIVREYPDKAEVHYFLAMAEYGQRNLELAQAELEKAVELNPGFYKARMLLAQVLLDRQDFEGAITATDPLVAGLRVHPEAVLIRSAALLGLNHPEKARQLLEKLLEARPNHARAWERLGQCYLALGKPKKALTAFTKALDADPANIEPLVLISKILVAEGNVEKAVNLVKRHIASAGDSADARTLLGRLRVRLKDIEGARQEFQRAIDLNPNAAEPYLLLAQLHQGPEARAKALVDLENAVKQRPNYLPAWMLKGTLHDLRGEVEEANRAYRKAIELNPDFAPALNNLAWNLAEHGGNIDEALKFAQRAVELVPDSAPFNDTLGWIYVKKGVYLKAVRHLESAAGELTGNPVVQYHLGVAYARLGEKEKAERALRKALDIASEFPGAEQARAELKALNPGGTP